MRAVGFPWHSLAVCCAFCGYIWCISWVWYVWPVTWPSAGVGSQMGAAAGLTQGAPRYGTHHVCLLSPGRCHLGWLLRVSVWDTYPRRLSGVLVHPALGLWVPWFALLGFLSCCMPPLHPCRGCLVFPCFCQGWCVHPSMALSASVSYPVEKTLIASPVHFSAALLLWDPVSCLCQHLLCFALPLLLCRMSVSACMWGRVDCMLWLLAFACMCCIPPAFFPSVGAITISAQPRLCPNLSVGRALSGV